MKFNKFNIGPFILNCFMVICLVLSCFGCSKEEDPVNDSIIGNWEWFKSIDYWTLEITTPETEGYTSALKFETNDSVLFFKNEILTNTYPYKLKYRINDILNPNSDSTLVLVINNGTETFFSIYNDTLLLNQSYVDGPRDYYERKK